MIPSFVNETIESICLRDCWEVLSSECAKVCSLDLRLMVILSCLVACNYFIVEMIGKNTIIIYKGKNRTKLVIFLLYATATCGLITLAISIKWSLGFT